MRPVYVPKVTDAIFNYPQGRESYIQSTKNFVLTIQPTGDNIGKVPVVKTNRTSIPDSEGVLIEDNKDGTYTATIFYVQSAIDLSIDFATGNNVIDGNKVWTANSQLYINSKVSGDAKVYNTTGALVKIITLSAGETNTTKLPARFYVVTVGDKNQKVVVK